MAQDKLPDRSPHGYVSHIGESGADYRERMALIQAEALEHRHQQLHEQSSPLNTPSARISIWERLHQVQLPRNPAHRLIAVIAANTGLSAEDVLAEQRSRMTAAPAVSPDAPE
jgi:hypothetical protein